MANQNTIDTTFDLPAIQDRIQDSERDGFVLTKIEATNVRGRDVTAVSFNRQMPNDGPFSQLLLKGSQPPTGTNFVFDGEAFVKGTKKAVIIVR